MVDVHSKEVRSYNMSRIRGKDTKPEMLVRKHLFGQGFRYRLHEKKLPGRPDIIFPKYKVAVFVHGCFWHSHKKCKYAVTPKSNKDYWVEKINKNITRDSEATKQLISLGWRVITIWECELKQSVFQETMNRVGKEIINTSGLKIQYAKN